MNWKCDFSLNHYFEVLNHYKEEYSIGKLKDFFILSKKDKFIILRHDVDFSLEKALHMAEAESENGLSSTFFIPLHSQFYNALSKNSVSIIKKISELGHEIGLHYDTSFLSESSYEEIQQIKNEIKILEKILQIKIISVAPHVPSVTRQLSADLNKEGLLDAMSPKILEKTKYISESAYFWREGCMCNHIGKQNSLVVLTHPIWWDNTEKSRMEILEELIKEKQNVIKSNIMDYRKMARELLEELNVPKDQIDI